MRKTGRLHIILELVTILSYIIIGVTVLTFLSQSVEANKSYVGSIVLAIGVTELVDFISLKYLIKLKNIPNAIAAILGIALGIVILALKKDLEVVCIVWGICSIVLQVIKIVNAGLNLLRQPFLNSFVIILCIVEVIYAIFLIVKKEQTLYWHLMFVGIAMLVNAFLLIVEFMIHRYQK